MRCDCGCLELTPEDQLRCPDSPAALDQKVSDAPPPFSGDDPTCVKCGHEGASTLYLAHGRCIHAPGPEIAIGFEPNERLHRECGRCGYQWDEAITGGDQP